MSSTNPANILPEPRPRRWRDTALLLGLLGAMLFGLIALAAATGWQETMAQFAKLGWPQIALLLALSIVNYLFRALRWHLFARRLGLGTGLLQDLRHFFGGFAMIVTPGRVGELVRMRWLRRETGRAFEKTAPLVLIDRASDLSAMALILGISIALSGSQIAGAVPVSVLALLAALIVTRPRLMLILADLGYRLLPRWPRLFARIRGAARSLSVFSNPGLIASTAAIGVLGWWAEAYAFYLILGWMGADISLATATAIFVFSIIVGGLTGAPGGVGGADAALVALLLLQGVPLTIALPATAIIRITTLWFGIAIGLLVFPIAERQSKKVANALENN